MDTEEFRIRGKEMVDYICEYMSSIKDKRVTPSVEPGYLRKSIPTDAPEEPEAWEEVMRDVESKIMPGVTHWQHPRFHAYFPAGNSYPSILGDMLSDGIGCIGFSWAASPALTELETIVLDWLGKAIGLPKDFLALEEGSKGGGVIEGSASECILVVMLAARANAIKRLKQQHPAADDGVLLSKLIAYCSKEAHSCVEKAAMICFVKLRILQPDEKSSLRGETLRQAMEEDEEAGRVPFFVSTTLGTTSCCSFDALPELGRECSRRPAVWLHVDAAYAGGALLCPEMRHLLQGIDYADSFNTNPNKWLLVNFDCSTLWVRNRYLLTSALVVDPLYLKHGYDNTAIDYRHWGVPLSRRFRSLKIWFVMRSYGISGLQAYVRHHMNLAKYFEKLVLRDKRFEVCNDVQLGLVCFRLSCGDADVAEADRINQRLLSNINASGRLHMVPACVRERFIIRFCVVAQHSTQEDMDTAWEIITEFATELQEGSDKEKEMVDLNQLLQKRHKDTLAYKRSFFVRMVSDPKIYNPAIAAASTPAATTPAAAPPAHPAHPAASLPKEPNTAAYAATASVSHTVSSPDEPDPNASPKSWISWPLAFFFQSVDNDSSNDLPIRFRHLDTMVRLKSPAVGANTGSRRGSTPSPDRGQADGRRSGRPDQNGM